MKTKHALALLARRSPRAAAYLAVLMARRPVSVTAAGDRRRGVLDQLVIWFGQHPLVLVPYDNRLHPVDGNGVVREKPFWGNRQRLPRWAVLSALNVEDKLEVDETERWPWPDFKCLACGHEAKEYEFETGPLDRTAPKVPMACPGCGSDKVVRA